MEGGDGVSPFARYSASKYTVFSVFLRICAFLYGCTEFTIKLQIYVHMAVASTIFMLFYISYKIIYCEI